MNIIEAVKSTLSEYPKIKEFCSTIDLNYADSKNSSAGLFPTGDSLIKEDILGNQLRRHNFMLYAKNQSFSNFDRLANSSFLLDLGYWLEQRTNIPITVNIGSVEKNGVIKSIGCNNAMLYNVASENTENGVEYQLQIHAEYSVESEEI